LNGTANLQAFSKATSDMWGGQKDVQDLVRGIRAHKKEEANYIRECLQEIKEELKEENHQKKSLAVQKLTYVSVTPPPQLKVMLVVLMYIEIWTVANAGL
jgi:hypothetical protein